LPFIRISNLRGVRDTALFNSRRLHHCKRIHFSPTLLYARPLAPDRSESVSRGRLPIFKMVNDTLGYAATSSRFCWTTCAATPTP
jgi:hypothetical protein